MEEWEKRVKELSENMATQAAGTNNTGHASVAAAAFKSATNTTTSTSTTASNPIPSYETEVIIDLGGRASSSILGVTNGGFFCCLICRRKFRARQGLKKHLQKSAMHSAKMEGQYRDRDRERRKVD